MRQGLDAQGISSVSTYGECMANPDTTFEQCQAMPDAP